MDIKEVQKKRDYLEKTVYDLIIAFQKDTDVEVSSIDLQTSAILGKKQPELYGIKITVNIN